MHDPEGKNDGAVAGVRYFECPENCGLFVKRTQAKIDPDAPADSKEKKKKKATGTGIPKVGSSGSSGTLASSSMDDSEVGAKVSQAAPQEAPNVAEKGVTGFEQGPSIATNLQDHGEVVSNASELERRIHTLENRIEELTVSHATELSEMEARNQAQLGEKSSSIRALEHEVEKRKIEIVRLTADAEASNNSAKELK